MGQSAGRSLKSFVDDKRASAVARTKTSRRAAGGHVEGWRAMGEEFEFVRMSSHRLGQIGLSVLPLDAAEVDGRLEASP